MPFLDKIGFFLLSIYLFLFFFIFFVNLYPTAPTKCCIPHCCHQMLYPTLLSPNVVYRFVATKCRKLDKKNDYRRWGGGKKNDFWWFYTPLILKLIQGRITREKILTPFLKIIHSICVQFE